MNTILRISKADKNNRRRDTREQILKIAENIIAMQGVSALSLKAIAAELGIRPPSIYTHFSGLDDITEVVSQRVYGSFSNISQKGTRPNDALGALEWHIFGLVDHMVENPAYLQLMLRDFGSVAHPDNISDAVNERIERSFENVNRVLQVGVDQGVFRTVNVESYLAHIYGSALISLCWSGISPSGGLTPVAPIQTIKEELLLLAKAYLANK